MWDSPIEFIEHHQSLLPESLKGRTKELEMYLDSIWQSRTLFAEDDPKKPVPSRQPFLRFELTHGKLTVRTGQYVGFIQFEGHTIQILPKLFNYEQADLAFQHLLWWLSYSQRVKFPFADLLTDSESIDNFPEALIRYFARVTRRWVSSQPYHQYEEITEVMSYVRGRLNTQAYINTSLSRGNWHRLVCDHEPFQFNNRLNQIIKYVTRRLTGLCSQLDTRYDLEKILFVLDEVDDVACTVQDCDSIQLNRFFQEYEICLDMCRFFLTHQYLNRQNAQQRHFCFLVPMNQVYEDFIAEIIKAHLGDRFKVTTQAENHLASTWPNNKSVFKIKNDLLLTDNFENRLVVDTKYKVRDYSQADGKSGINQNDLYQMVSYALRQNTRQVLLLYPLKYDQEPTESQTFHVASELINGDPIRIQAIDLPITGASKQEMVDKLVKQLATVLGNLILTSSHQLDSSSK